jgi:hypothetical protein
MIAAASISLMGAVVFGQAVPAGQGAQTVGSTGQVGAPMQTMPNRPAPRLPDGRINLGPVPGEIGLWLPFTGGNERLVNPDNITPEQAAQYTDRPTFSQVPMQPWARALHSYRRANQLEPHTRCKASGGPRQFITPYGVEFFDVPDHKRIFIIDIGGPHTFRTIYTDGRPHPANLEPTYYVHSIGRWDGYTLVVDTKGFNEGFWFDRSGLPHTENLHLIERFTRTDYKTMKYEVRVDDPGAYTAPWSASFLLGWDFNQELFEYVCQDNNFASTLMVGAAESIDRTTPIVP